ncbi:MAG: BNR-4 repeat-containing protein [Bryobacteraceae bacterium]
MLFPALVALLAAQPIVFNDDGGWCWFEDERAVISGGRLVIGSVAAGTRDPARKGAIEATVYNLATGKTSRFTLHGGGPYWLDDHNSPAFVARPDGRLVAMYAQHGRENTMYYRISAAGNPAEWGAERTFAPSAKSRVTYTNLHWLPAEKRIYDFFRGFDNSFKPSYAWSDDLGETWKPGGVFLDVPTQFRHRPYVKYAGNGKDAVHIAYTDGHPRNIDNSIYHIYYRAGKLYRSDGALIRTLAEGLKSPGEGTRVFQGDPNNVAWISDIHLDAKERPFLVYSVQKDSAGLDAGQGGHDFRYRYARWNGKRWEDHEIAHGGSKLYAGEDDYTGNLCLDPRDPNTVFISTNADPESGKPMPHWEIYRGTTRDGAKFAWKPVTANSQADNIRPIVPISKDKRRVLLWLRGKMRTYTNYDFAVVGLIE